MSVCKWAVGTLLLSAFFWVAHMCTPDQKKSSIWLMPLYVPLYISYTQTGHSYYSHAGTSKVELEWIWFSQNNHLIFFKKKTWNTANQCLRNVHTKNINLSNNHSNFEQEWPQTKWQKINEFQLHTNSTYIIYIIFKITWCVKLLWTFFCCHKVILLTEWNAPNSLVSNEMLMFSRLCCECRLLSHYTPRFWAFSKFQKAQHTKYQFSDLTDLLRTESPRVSQQQKTLNVLKRKLVTTPGNV